MQIKPHLLLLAARLLLLAAAVPDEEVEDLPLRVLDQRSLDVDRNQRVLAAAVVCEPPQERAVEQDAGDEPVEVNARVLVHKRTRLCVAARRSRGGRVEERRPTRRKKPRRRSVGALVGKRLRSALDLASAAKLDLI